MRRLDVMTNPTLNPAPDREVQPPESRLREPRLPAPDDAARTITTLMLEVAEVVWVCDKT